MTPKPSSGTPETIRRLVGGYATGTLSEAQRKLLFEAALEDQELFDELAEEQAVKQLLEAPGVRQRLLASIEPQPQIVWWKHPLPWALGGVAMAISLLLMGIVFLGPSGSKPKPVEVAETRPPVIAETPFAQPVTPSPPKLRNEPGSGVSGFGARQSAPPLPNEPKPAEPRPVSPPVSPPVSKDSGTAAPAPPAELPNEPKKKAQTAATGTLAPPPLPELPNEPKLQAEQVKPAARAPSAAPPPANAARDSLAGGGPGPAPPPARPSPQPTARALAAAKAAPIGRFAFEYSIHDGVLRIVPESAGYLLVRAVVGPLDRLMLSTAHLTAGRPAELSVPDGASSVVVLFSARPVQEDSTDDLAARAPVRTELTGTVEDPRPTVISRLEVRITLRGK